MDDDDKAKTYYSQHDTSLEEKSFKIKTFNLFYEISKEKQYNKWAISIFIILEMLQLISYAFDEPHKLLWKIKESNIDKIATILGATRIVTLMEYINFPIYMVIFILLIVIIFVLFLYILMEILLLNQFQTKLYEKCVFFTNLLINPICTFLFIPISELILLPLKCKNGNIDIVKNGAKCYENLYYLYFILGIIGSILLLICCLYLIFFYFFPFQYYSSELRTNSNNEIILLISKFIIIYRMILIKNQYISILIILILNLFLLTNEFHNPTYNNYFINLICSIRNISGFWTYFILLVAKILQKTDINGIVYLLLFGYPIIIICFIIFLNKKELSYENINDKFENINNYLLKTSFRIKLIHSFLDNTKNIINSNNLDYQKNEILLKGSIQKHNDTCLNEECPLVKFSNNFGNYYVQKQSLLNYMNIYFEKGVKRFPQSIKLLIYYIQFNYKQRYNLNSVRTNLTKLKKLEKTFHEEFIIYCIEENVKKMKNKINDSSDNNEQELEKDLIEQKIQRLKFLIENSTKLYGEFWGIFATNITNNLNMLKLYTLGGKLNKYLKEINNIWDTDIKSKKIDLSQQSIIQLYSHFLKDILWNKKKSDEIIKKLNDEHHHRETKKIDEENFHGNNLEALLENQDFIIFCNSNDKGKCTIIQCSNSITNLLGYEKSEIIGKSLEILMPNILIEFHLQTLQEYIANLNISQKPQQDFSRGNDNKQILFLPKNKVGYIMPYTSKFVIYDDNDFSNSYIIKAKLEPKENKSIYTYYILTKNDFTVTNISSSTLYLGLSMDLLKKHMIKMDVLIRTNDDRKIKIGEHLGDFEEHEKEIIWVYPDVVYPKNNFKKKENAHIDNLIKYSQKKKLLLKIFVFRNNKDEKIGYCFRLTDLNKKENNIKFEKFIPKMEKEFLFDIIKLHYIRTITVEKKTGGRNLRDKEEERDYDKRSNNSQINKNENKKRNSQVNKDTIEEDEEGKKEYVLTKEKINELQGENYFNIKNFINNLTFFGRDVQLEKHRPNRERYPVGRIQEPSIKILIANFCNNLQKREGFRLPNMSGSYNNNLNERGENKKNSSEKKLSDDLNKEFSTDIATSFSNIFNAKSIFYIKLLSLCIIVLIIIFIILEFIFTFIHLNDIKARIDYLEYGYQLLSNMLYIKYFISEAVFANEIPKRFHDNNEISYYYNINERKEFIIKIKKELADYLVLFNRLFNNFNSPVITLSPVYLNYTAKAKLPIYAITISEKDERESIINETFSSGMRRIPSDVFYISSNPELIFNITMKNQNCYGLMQNILNTFYTTWQQATVILFNDVKKHCSKSTLSYVILVSSFVVTIICLFLTYKLLTIFSNDREKPINLFLTIKKNIFEELKNASEGFSNKLLNKFFGNEENEEETQQDYTTNIKENDINIIKFKAPNEHKLTGNKDKTNIMIFIQLTLFLIFCNAYIVFKFCYTFDNIQNISKFIDVFNTTHMSHSNIILSIDILKSFLFNDFIPIFNKNNENETLNIFLKQFYEETNNFEETILATSKSNSFLDSSYKDKFYEYLYHDYYELVKSNISINYIEKRNKFNPILNKLFEDLKYISLKYLNYGFKEKREIEKANNTFKGYPSEIVCDKIWVEIHEVTTIYIRFWFKNILDLMSTCLNDYVNKMRLIHITIFIILIIIIIFAYCIVWKNYEHKLKSMLDKSFNLINLIPEEIKYMIIRKLNE